VAAQSRMDNCQTYKPINGGKQPDNPTGSGLTKNATQASLSDSDTVLTDVTQSVHQPKAAAGQPKTAMVPIQTEKKTFTSTSLLSMLRTIMRGDHKTPSTH